MTTDEQFNRIVSLVAELTRRSRQGEESPTLSELAGRFGTTPRQVESDIRTLTLLGEDPEADWLLSLRVTQEKDRVSIESAGPFRRPLRLTGEEVMALQLGLVNEAGPAGVSTDLARVLKGAERQTHALAGHGRVMLPVHNLARKAITDRRKIEIRYAGEQSLAGTNRVIHPYQLIEQEGHSYIVAWCELAEAWRHFRTDRVLDALPTDSHYPLRGDFTPADRSFHEPTEGTTAVQVRFSPAIARWLKERHPEAPLSEDGSVVVTYSVASPEWLVRHVLQYGDEAEVLHPESFRHLLERELLM